MFSTTKRRIRDGRGRRRTRVTLRLLGVPLCWWTREPRTGFDSPVLMQPSDEMPKA